jgi:hypothetical protein
MQDAKVFEKQATPDFSKTCGQRRSRCRTHGLSIESPWVSENFTTQNATSSASDSNFNKRPSFSTGEVWGNRNHCAADLNMR